MIAYLTGLLIGTSKLIRNLTVIHRQKRLAVRIETRLKAELAELRE